MSCFYRGETMKIESDPIYVILQAGVRDRVFARVFA